MIQHIRLWISGARPATLPLSLVAVALGVACGFAITRGEISGVVVLLCFFIAFFLQIGVNYANDYSDGIRGTDNRQVRQGPVRLVGSGLMKPKVVLIAALLMFGLAAIAGLVVIWLTGQWWLLSIGLACLAAAWFYTGGKRPYGYGPFGELSVFLFFGLVPVVITTYVLSGGASIESWIAGIIAGLFAVAVLLTNNLRDREKDAVHGKRTLSVVIGKQATRVLYTVVMLLPFVLLAYFAVQSPAALLIYAALPIFAAPTLANFWTASSPLDLVASLKQTLLTATVFELGLAASISYF